MGCLALTHRNDHRPFDEGTGEVIARGIHLAAQAITGKLVQVLGGANQESPGFAAQRIVGLA